MVLRLIVFRLLLCEVSSLLKGIVVLLLLDGIRNGFQGRFGRRHDRRCEEYVGWTSRNDGGCDSEVAEAGSQLRSDFIPSRSKHACVTRSRCKWLE